MYRSVKIPEETYKKAKSLSRELKGAGDLKGVHKVTLSNAISYAIVSTLESLRRKHKLVSSAGGWSDLDTRSLVKDIYKSRTVSRRKEVAL